MKNMFTLVIFSALFISQTSSQSMLKGSANLDFQTISGETDFFSDWQVGIEYLMNDNISIGGTVGLIINEGLAYILDADLKYYSGENFEGWGIGGFSGLGFDSYSFYLRFGVEGFYSYKISEYLAIQPQLRLGYGYINSGYDIYLNTIGGGGILISPGASLAYTF